MHSLLRFGTEPFGPEVDSARLADHLADCLLKVDASAIEVDAAKVRFRGGIFRLVSSWNVLVPFGFGELTVDPSAGQVSYCLSIGQLVGIATGLVAFGAAFMLLGDSPPGTFVFLPLMWAWLVGGNVLIGIPRFKQFLRRAIAKAPRRVKG